MPGTKWAMPGPRERLVGELAQLPSFQQFLELHRDFGNPSCTVLTRGVLEVFATRDNKALLSTPKALCVESRYCSDFIS